MKTPIIKMVHLGAFLVLTAGCSVAPDYVHPETDTADTWSESTDSALSADAVDYGPWWTVFEDPVLEQLVQIAQKDNLPLQIAAVRILEARAGLGFARGLRFPQQQLLSGQAAKVSLSENAPNVAIADQSFSAYDVGFEAAREVEDQLTRTEGEVALNLVATYKALGDGWEVPAGRAILKPSVEAEIGKRTNWGDLLPPNPAMPEQSDQAQQ